jgi:two-component system, chemotaxis family, protein-glutamate methylesterase/glutaminase
MINVMLVDDSAVIRGLIGRIIDAEPDMQVSGSAQNGGAALELLRLRSADVVLLDIDMPEMDGLTALPLILKENPSSRVIMLSALTTRGAEITMRALALGAADYIGKPSALSAVRGVEAISRELVAKIRALAVPAHAGSDGSVKLSTRKRLGLVNTADDRYLPPQVLVIASSTGGPNALARVLSQLPRDFSLPILIAQHMPPLFTASLAERLEREAQRPCREARDGETIQPGHTYMAPGDFHMRVRRVNGQPIIRLDQGPAINFCRPSADALLESVVEVYRGSVLTLILTGMGEDGLRGCQAVARAGGRIIAQDRATSVVWGMPGAVANAGIASMVLPIDAIAPHLGALCPIAA